MARIVIRLPHIIFRTVSLSFKNIAANIMVKSGVVNIKTVASDTGISMTQVKAVSIVRLPNIPTRITIIFSNIILGHSLLPGM